MVQIFLYVISHLCGILLLIKRKEAKVPYILLSIMSLSIIQYIKPDTYDIISYTESVSYTYPPYEPLFSFLIIILRPSMENRTVIFVIQIMIFSTLVFVFYNMRYQFAAKYKVLLGMAVALLSPAFLLGINNALRQFWASIFLVYALYFYWKNKKNHKLFFHYCCYIVSL